jgi:hypothetical protein
VQQIVRLHRPAVQAVKPSLIEIADFAMAFMSAAGLLGRDGIA